MGGTDGYYPWAGLTTDNHGHLFGTTLLGGTGSCGGRGCGIVFKVTPNEDFCSSGYHLSGRSAERDNEQRRESGLHVLGARNPDIE